MRRLPLVLLLPLALACEVKDAGTATDGASSGGATDATDGASGATSGEPVTTGGASEPLPTSTSGEPGTTDATADPDATTGPGPGTSTGDPGTTTGAVDPDEGATQLCVDTINMYRATLGLPALARWKDAEDCADAECVSDGMTGVPHGAFGMCGESAQNECPGWPGDPETLIVDCLAVMWAEGPGEDFNLHGHYINMSNPAYTRVACGFAPGMGGIWAIQNFQ